MSDIIQNIHPFNVLLRSVNHLPDAQRRAQLERSLNKKLSKMEEKRQTKKKEK